MFASAIRDLKNKNKKEPRVQLVNRQNIESKYNYICRYKKPCYSEVCVIKARFDFGTGPTYHTRRTLSHNSTRCIQDILSSRARLAECARKGILHTIVLVVRVLYYSCIILLLHSSTRSSCILLL